MSSKAKLDIDYPKIPIKVIEIPRWSATEQVYYIKDRVDLHKNAEGLKDDLIPECTPEERWAEPTKWAIYKGTNKTASKLVLTEEQAQEFVKNAPDKFKWTIIKRPGKDRRCEDYCTVNKFCHYWRYK